MIALQSRNRSVLEKQQAGYGEEGGVDVEGAAVPVTAVGSLKALGWALSL